MHGTENLDHFRAGPGAPAQQAQDRHTMRIEFAWSTAFFPFSDQIGINSKQLAQLCQGESMLLPILSQLL